MLLLSLGPLSPTRKEIKHEFFIIILLYFSLRYSKTSTVCKVVHPASTWCIRPSSVPARPNISNVAYYTRARHARMAQFWLKIAHLSFSMASTPLLKMMLSYGLRLRLWLLSVDEILTGGLMCDHSNKSYSTVLSCNTNYYPVKGGCKFLFCGAVYYAVQSGSIF